MKRFVLTLKFTLRVLMLFFVFAAAWAYANIHHLFKISDKDKKNGISDLFSAKKARADTPNVNAKGTSTPFLAYFNGKNYKLENDILFGRPKSYHPSYAVAQSLYESGNIAPDLYKIASAVKIFGGKLLFQIQEIELEESFFKHVSLQRITHSQGTEIMVDSEYKNFHVVDKKAFLKNLVVSTVPKKNDMSAQDSKNLLEPKRMLWNFDTAAQPGIQFSRGDSVEFLFKNLKTGETPYLVVKSWFRDWVIGLEEEWKQDRSFFGKLIRSASLARSALVLSFFILTQMFASRRGISLSTLGPLFMLADGGPGTGSGSGPSGGGPSGPGPASGDPAESPGNTDPGSFNWFKNPNCSFSYEYEDNAGNYRLATISEPRAWHYNTELIELPKEAVKPNGEMKIRISSSKRHALGFVGAIQKKENWEVKKYGEEKLTLSKAYHHRLQKDFSDSLQDSEGEYLHTLPGDTVDLEFEASNRPLKKGKKETYLIRSSGFYTSLRDENRKLVGNWEEKISSEAKGRLASLVNLKDYE